MKWIDVTESFSEARRHYQNTYMEICEVLDDLVEISLFSSTDGPFEIYVSFDIMYGVSYVEARDAKKVRTDMKEDLEREYKKNHKPSDGFIKSFTDKYRLRIENSLFNEGEIFRSLLGMM